MRLNRWLIVLVPFCALWLASCDGSAPAVHTFPIGQKVKMGNLIYIAIDTQWLSTFGEGPTARAAQNQFLLVRLSVTNSGTSEAPVPNFSVADTAGNRFPELTDGSGAPDWIGALRTLAPADTLVGNALFDVATGHYTLDVLDEESQHEARIDLPLNFQRGPVEAPGLDLRTPPAPGEKK